MPLTKNILYLLVFLEGTTVICYELAAVRMIAPWCGETLYVWTSVIAITVLSLAAGYLLGGRLSQKAPPPLLFLMLFSSACFLLMPHFSRILFPAVQSNHYVLSAVLSALTVVPLPLIPLSAVPPLAVKMLTPHVAQSGRQTGRVYALSTAGGILSAILSGFYLIPTFGITWCIILTGIMTGIIPLVFLEKNKLLYAGLYLFIAVFAIAGATKKQRPDNSVSILEFSEGLPGQNLVTDFRVEPGKTQRFFYINRMGQTAVNMQTGRSLWSYPDYATSVASILPEGSKILLLGLGGGTVANYFSGYIKFNVTGVEIDNRIIAIARRHFNMNNDINVIIDDARHYLETTHKKYDLIMFDVFKGDVIPHHVMSREAIKKAISLLNDGGFLIINFNGFLAGNEGKAGRILCNTIKSCGLEVKILPTFEEQEKYRNNLFIGMTKPLDFSKTRLPLNKDGVVIPLEELFAQIPVMDKNEVLTDDQPFLDAYNFSAASAWRKEYNNKHTRILLQKGIPLFW